MKKHSFQSNKLPNAFTKDMGKQIREARIQAGMTQAELGRKVNRRRETISLLENGRSEANSRLIVRLAELFNKSILFFFPKSALVELDLESLNAEEHEMISSFRELENVDMRKLALEQLRLLGDVKKK